jgi:flagellar biosynthetic protein FliP
MTENLEIGKPSAPLAGEARAGAGKRSAAGRLLRAAAVLAVLLAAVSAGRAWAQGSGNMVPIPTVSLSLDQADDSDRIATVINVMFLLTVLALAPSILVMMTSFVRIVVIFGFLRQAMGTQQTPPNQIIVSLALFMTFFVMMPVWRNVEERAYKPFMANEITQREAFDRAMGPIRDFMFMQTRQTDLALFMRISGESKPFDRNEVPTLSLIPAFIISELKTAFTIGFLLYMPFLVIDMVVASVLLSMGMMMLPPVMISLPFKLMLFVLVDGWALLSGSVVRSFGDVGSLMIAGGG